jgi:uncharacterized lipoprotein YajG
MSINTSKVKKIFLLLYCHKHIYHLYFLNKLINNKKTNMKKYILGLVMISMLAACSSQETETSVVDSTSVDTTVVVSDTTVVESVETVESAK